MGYWAVDCKKLRGNDKQAVSPPFHLEDESLGTFRILVYPKAVNDKKGGASFRKSGGRGSVHLKCEGAMESASNTTVSLRVSAGRDQAGCGPVDSFRGPVRHAFSSSGLCGLPKDQEEWDFTLMVDEV